MECKDILNLIAIVVIPIVAVVIGQHLQNRAEIRKDRMHIFKVLMTSRIYGWTQESVHCLNIIDIVFSDDKKVRNAWKDLFDKYHIEVDYENLGWLDTENNKNPFNRNLKKPFLYRYYQKLRNAYRYYLSTK